MRVYHYVHMISSSLDIDLIPNFSNLFSPNRVIQIFDRKSNQSRRLSHV